jgi:SAM-dependent methyltransferase
MGCISSFGPVVQDMILGYAGYPRPRVADLGIGTGIYGVAVRQWIDFGRSKGNLAYLIGVEGFVGYKTPIWEVYDHVHICPIQEWVERDNDKFDVILLNDVIEHFTKSEGHSLVERLKDRLAPAGKLYVSTPGIFFEQGALCGNDFEVHKCLWTEGEFRALGLQIMRYAGVPFDGVTVDGLGHRVLAGVFQK